MAYDRQKAKDDLLRRTKHSYDTKDFAGVGPAYMKQLPRPYWKCKEGKHMFDVIPWVAGPNFPDPEVNEGDFVYVLDIWVHQNVGPMGISMLCPAHTFKGKSCPICEKVKQMRDEEADKASIDAVRAKRRVLYNIFCFDSAQEEAKEVQIFEVSHWFMERNLAALSENPKTGGHIIFADPDVGKSISFERKGSGLENTQYLGHQFLDREGAVIDDALLDQAVQLEEFLIIPTYKELYETFYNKKLTENEDRGYVDAGENNPPSRRSRQQQSAQETTREEAPESTLEKGKCAFGGIFGTDIDKLIQCNDCPLYIECGVEKSKEDKSSDAKVPASSGNTLRRRSRS